MPEEMDEKEREIVRHIYHCAAIRELEKSTDEAASQLKKYFPRVFEIMKEITFEELLEILNRNKMDPIYGEKIRECISQENLGFVREMHRKIKEFPEE